MSYREQQRLWRLAGRYSAIGIEMTLAVAMATLGGIWLDKKLDTTPIFLWVGLVIGFGAVVQIVLKVVRDARRDNSS